MSAQRERRKSWWLVQVGEMAEFLILDSNTL